MNTNRLRGEIVAEFKTQTAFAKAIKWHENKVSKMITGKYIPTVDEAAEISELLHLTISTYKEIFLDLKSPNGVNKIA